jgi:hypothetical protein
MKVARTIIKSKSEIFYGKATFCRRKMAPQIRFWGETEEWPEMMR